MSQVHDNCIKSVHQIPDLSNASSPHIDHLALKEWFYQTEPEAAMHKSTTSKKIGKRFVGRVSTILVVVAVVVGGQNMSLQIWSGTSASVCHRSNHHGWWTLIKPQSQSTLCVDGAIKSGRIHTIDENRLVSFA